MKVLVTGASGFIGREAVAALTSAGAEVIACGRSLQGAPASPNTIPVSIDLLNDDAVRTMIAQHRPDRLLHLAWYVEPGKFWSSPANMDWMAASARLLRYFFDAGGQGAVLAGTCAEYAWTGSSLLGDDTHIAPATFYGTVKDSLRRTALGLGDIHNLPVSWGRIFWLYGPGEARGRLVSDVCVALAKGQRVEVGEGLQERDFLHVRDAGAIFAAALKNDIRGVFNIGSGQAVAVKTLVAKLGDISQRPDLIAWGARPTPANEPHRLYADTRRLSEVGHIPKIGLDEGLEETFRFWNR